MKYVKYPKTPYLPYSPGREEGDRTLDREALERLLAGPIVTTLKLDGENVTLYDDHLHARSLDTKGREDRDWIKALHGSIKHQIPPKTRICGEYLFARHSIAYAQLRSYFQVFSIWEDERCLPWEDTVALCSQLGLITVPVISLGMTAPPACLMPEVWATLYHDLEGPHDIVTEAPGHEGYVIRTAAGFEAAEFSTSIAKWVRPNHIKTDEHWRNRAVVKNTLKEVR